MPAQATGAEATRLRGLGRPGRKLKCGVGWTGLSARRGVIRVRALWADALFSSHGSASTRALAPAPQSLPYTNTHRHRHFPASPCGGLASLGGKSGLSPPPRSSCSRADRRGCAREWGRGGPALPPPPPPRAPPPPPPPSPHGVPRPGRLCPMRRGVAGRWGVFLFWVEVEAEEGEEQAKSSRPCRGRCGRWRRSRGSREVPPPRQRPLPAAPLPLPSPGTPGPARGP